MPQRETQEPWDKSCLTCVRISRLSEGTTRAYMHVGLRSTALRRLQFDILVPPDSPTFFRPGHKALSNSAAALGL